MTKKLLGTFFELGGCGVMEALTRTGLDYVIIDTEHGYFSEESTADYIRAAENGGLLPYVRIGSVQRPYVLRMLDIGARGLIVPNITSLEQVEELVRWAKFPPVGQRGYCPTRTTAWGADDWSKDALSYMSECNRRASIFPQCETAEALEQVEAIAAMEGVDGIFVGPCDLSIALGVPLEMDSPKLLSAIDRVLEACQRYGKQSIIFAGTPEKAREMFRKGFDSVAYSLDASMLISAVKAQAETCRAETSLWCAPSEGQTVQKGRDPL